MIATVEIQSYDIRALSDEKYREMREFFPDMEEDKEKYWHFVNPRLIDLDTVGAWLVENKIEFKIVAFPNNMLVTLKDKVDQWTKEHRFLIEQRYQQGNVVQVHVPNIGLLAINEVTNLDDCCTKELQMHLDEGWSILAVCPPNAQRRPDYILGRVRIGKQ